MINDIAKLIIIVVLIPIVVLVKTFKFVFRVSAGAAEKIIVILLIILFFLAFFWLFGAKIIQILGI